MAILAAFNSPEVEVLGLTSIYGNVPTAMATRNALTLCQLAGRPEVLAAGWLCELVGTVEPVLWLQKPHGCHGR